MKDSTKKFLKGVLIFVAGATLGSLVAYEIARHKYEVIYEYDDEDHEPKHGDWQETTRQVQDGLSETKDGKVLFISKDRYKKTINNLGYNGDSGDIDPAELEGPPEDPTDDEEIYEYEKMSSDANGHSDDEPHVITLEEFTEEMTHYDKITLSFYEDDEVLTDETEEIIDDPVTILGEGALNSFGIGSEDPEVVYVRNDNLQIDYEVIRLSKSYKETVLGDVEGRG